MDEEPRACVGPQILSSQYSYVVCDLDTLKMIHIR